MPITAICLLKLPNLPLPAQGPVRAEALEDCVLLHTTLDFADDPEDVAGAVFSLLGEPLASQHEDERGLFLIPSVAVPSARSYEAVIAEVGEGGVWAPWDFEDEAEVMPLGAAGDLNSLLGSMLGQMPNGMLAQAAASLREDPNALGELLQQGSQMPELASMLKGLGVNVSSADLSQLTNGLQAELSRDPSRLLAMAESLFAGANEGADDDDDDDDDEKR